MLKVSPATGLVVNAVTVNVGAAAAVLDVISVACPRNAAVVVFRSKTMLRPLNCVSTEPAGVRAEETMLVVVEPPPTVPMQLLSTPRLSAVTVVVSLLIAPMLESILPPTSAVGMRV